MIVHASLALLLVAVVLAKDCPNPKTEARHQEVLLHKDLLCAYNSDFRPVKDHNTPVTIKVRFALKYISFDVLEETFTLHSWVALTWMDEFLTWTPSNYGDLKEIQVQSHEIWTPRMALFNADASLYPSDSFYTTCSITNEGKVMCVPHLAHSGICRTSLKRWPYDVQNCTLYFGSWMETGEQVNFTFYNSSPIIVDDYQNGPGWKLKKVVHKRMPGNYKCCPNSTYPMLKYVFTLEREAAGPAAIVVVPSIVIILLTLTSLLLDIKDNTRLVLACFSLFGHFIFLTEIGYDIPKHSADTPIILLLVRDSMIITLVSIMLTLLLMSIRRKTVPAPGWVVTVNRLISSGPGKYVVFTEFDPSEVVETKVLTDDGATSSQEEKSRAVADWIQFANLLNSLVFSVSLLAYVILLSVYLPYDDWESKPLSLT